MSLIDGIDFLGRMDPSATNGLLRLFFSLQTGFNLLYKLFGPHQRHI